MILLTPLDLTIAALLVLLLALVSWRSGAAVERKLLWSAVRTTLQLLLIGWILKLLFDQSNPLWIALMATIMLLIAGREVMSRQQRSFSGIWGYGMGTVAMFVSSFGVALIALQFIIRPEPWYMPQYAIPLLGMLLGNTMNGISLGLDRLTSSAWEQRHQLEAKLMLGFTARDAMSPLRRDAIRVGMIPMINAMAAAGVVSLPGMMTGQILAGAPPMEAVKYQILIMFLITVGTGFGTLVATTAGTSRLFDDRERLRLDRLKKKVN
ncbi:MAG: iron export ABC transporter permease subunit FetB [Gammaproteobacteria bacterium]|nr:iron export ABC transporter permease subunit FetB [Gammaproteobacteria bacterium]